MRTREMHDTQSGQGNKDFHLQSVPFEGQKYNTVSWRRRTKRRCCKAVLLILSGVQCCISKLDEKTAIKEICELVISIALEKCKKECSIV